MRPDSGERFFADLTSGDKTRIMDACRMLGDGADLEEALRYLAVRAAEIRATIDRQTFPPGILSMRQIVDRRLRQAEALVEGRCACTVWAADSLTRPGPLADRGVLVIEAEKTDREHYMTSFTCRCVACGTRYVVVEDMGWHMPTYSWQAI